MDLDMFPGLLSDNNVLSIQGINDNVRNGRFGLTQLRLIAVIPEPNSLTGDFNLDGVVDLLDIDDLGGEIGAGTNDLLFDLNSDDLVNQDDLTRFLGGNIIADGNKLNRDADFDGTVDFADFLTLSSNFGHEGKKWSEGDFVVNGRVEFDDFLTLSANFGQTAGSVTQVPEPHAQVTLIFMSVLLGCSRRRLGRAPRKKLPLTPPGM